MAMFGRIAVPPDGTHFLLIALVVVATLVGKIFTLVQLPALLGMLVRFRQIQIQYILFFNMSSYYSKMDTFKKLIALILIK